MTHPYASEAYAASLAHSGASVSVPEWRGHVLSRATPCGTRRDAMGPYPITVLPPDADLAGGRQRLGAAGFVSVVLVLEERLRPPLEALTDGFDFVRPFKSHSVYDRRLGPIAYSGQHRTKLKRALGRVERAELRLADHLPAWEALYGHLIDRHGLTGLHAFPPGHHQTLARLPGVRAFGAFMGGRLVSAHVFVAHQGHAISHLTASDPEGYASGAAYAVNDLAIAALSDCETINFGGGAGLGDDPGDGLVQFKRGFANTVSPSYLCGAILDEAAYRTLSGDTDSGFFPAYRAPGGSASTPATRG
ncbi:GNAT family N-acetyltransferase [Phenylobacterium sp.]|uniref:GNAT family N-acetyltransferase n=1 Tax=Phenylobacterium sp. TaxID=1871053 RepID=UPI0039833EB2